MKTIPILTLAGLGLGAASLPAFATPNLPTEKIQTMTGLKGKWSEEEGVFKLGRPRRGVPVSVEARALDPFVGFSSWAGFATGGKAEAMGDMVLFDDEAGVAMKAALGGGWNVTALHTHFLAEQPRAFYMPIEGEFDAVRAKQTAPAHLVDARLQAGPSAITPARQDSGGCCSRAAQRRGGGG